MEEKKRDTKIKEIKVKGDEDRKASPACAFLSFRSFCSPAADVFFPSPQNTARQLTTLLKLTLRKTGNRENDKEEEEEEKGTGKQFKVSFRVFFSTFHDSNAYSSFLLFALLFLAFFFWYFLC